MSSRNKPQINILQGNKMFLRKYADSNKLNLTLKVLVIHLCGSKNICVTFYLMATFQIYMTNVECQNVNFDIYSETFFVLVLHSSDADEPNAQFANCTSGCEYTIRIFI